MGFNTGRVNLPVDVDTAHALDPRTVQDPRSTHKTWSNRTRSSSNDIFRKFADGRVMRCHLGRLSSPMLQARRHDQIWRALG